MTWNYRIVEKDGYLYIHEAFYDKKTDTKPISITKDPIDVSGETKEEVKEVLEMMLKDIDRYEDILKYEDF